MRQGLLSALIAAAFVILIYPALPGILHPPKCSTVEAGGVVTQSFCISWDPVVGRYETPPAGVPADFALRSGYLAADPLVPAVFLFAGLTVVLRVVSSIVLRARAGQRGSRAVSTPD